jgi:hypothetical protein
VQHARANVCTGAAVVAADTAALLTGSTQPAATPAQETLTAALAPGVAVVLPQVSATLQGFPYLPAGFIFPASSPLGAPNLAPAPMLATTPASGLTAGTALAPDAPAKGLAPDLGPAAAALQSAAAAAQGAVQQLSNAGGKACLHSGGMACLRAEGISWPTAACLVQVLWRSWPQM